jgi:uncharacterized protein (DUF433 family)
MPKPPTGILVPADLANDLAKEKAVNQPKDPMAKIIVNPQLLGGLPIILGPVVAIQQPNGPPAGQQNFVSVLTVLSLLAKGITEEQMLQDPTNYWLTQDDIDACKEWFRRVVQVCIPANLQQATETDFNDDE